MAVENWRLKHGSWVLQPSSGEMRMQLIRQSGADRSSAVVSPAIGLSLGRDIVFGQYRNFRA